MQSMMKRNQDFWQNIFKFLNKLLTLKCTIQQKLQDNILVNLLEKVCKVQSCLILMVWEVVNRNRL